MQRSVLDIFRCLIFKQEFLVLKVVSLHLLPFDEAEHHVLNPNLEPNGL